MEVYRFSKHTHRTLARSPRDASPVAFDVRAMIGRYSALLFVVALGALASEAAMGEQLRVGDPSATSFDFIALDVGMKYGVFQRNNITIDRVSFAGGAKLHQAMAARAIDIALGSGSDFLFLVKGVPELAVAAMAGPPLEFGFVTRADFEGKRLDDLKDKRFGISTVASFPQWIVLQLAKSEGWKREDVPMITVGSDVAGQTAALTTNQVDVLVTSVAMGFQLEATKRGRLLFPASDVVHNSLTHVIFASKDIVASRPDVVHHFLKGWFESIAFMRDHRSETIDTEIERQHFARNVAEREYDLEMPMFSQTGRFAAIEIKSIQDSLVELGLLDVPPELRGYYTEQLLP
jgi:NitT/TauT family transport system substrate-binding protein